jgi:hypothetical protein
LSVVFIIDWAILQYRIQLIIRLVNTSASAANSALQCPSSSVAFPDHADFVTR